VINIEIVYAQTERSVAKSLELPQGARIADALAQAASDQEFSGIDLGSATVGIFGKVAPRDQLLKEGDRIEIYRPLLEEPKLARRNQARAQKTASRKTSKPGRS
jgi:uncharacterized protein